MGNASLVLAVGVLLACTTATRAQTLVNPDISVIGDMRVEARPTSSAARRGVNELEFVFEELELDFNAYLNPYMRADVFIGGHGGTEFEVEEAVMTVLRGLPASMQLRAGRFLLDFGKINTQHAHQWAWLERPLFHRAILGDEGVRADGVQLSTLRDVGDNAVTLSLDAFGSGAFAAEGGTAADSSGSGAPAPQDVVVSGRLSVFRQIGDFWMAELGVSGLYGTFDAAAGLRQRLGAVDLKVRWRPDAYRAFVWILEGLRADRDAALAGGGTRRVVSSGAFTSVDVRFRRRWDAGGFLDFAEDPDGLAPDRTEWGGFFGFMPAEETARISLVYRNAPDDRGGRDDHTVTLQFLWALGPHRPHTY